MFLSTLAVLGWIPISFARSRYVFASRRHSIAVNIGTSSHDGRVPAQHDSSNIENGAFCGCVRDSGDITPTHQAPNAGHGDGGQCMTMKTNAPTRAAHQINEIAKNKLSRVITRRPSRPGSEQIDSDQAFWRRMPALLRPRGARRAEPRGCSTQ